MDGVNTRRKIPRKEKISQSKKSKNTKSKEKEVRKMKIFKTNNKKKVMK